MKRKFTSQWVKSLLGSSSRLVSGGTHVRVEKEGVTAQPDRPGQP